MQEDQTTSTSDSRASAEAAVRARLDELHCPIDERIPCDLATLFPKLQGWGAKKDIKRRAKLLNRIAPQLAAMLSEHEEVHYVAKGVRYKFSEHYFLGIWAGSINHTVFVLTNARLIMMHTKSSGVVKNTFWMVYYSQIEDVKVNWTGSMTTLKLSDRKKLSFAGFPKTDRIRMPDLIRESIAHYDEVGFAPEVSQSQENLCSTCYQIVPVTQFDCKHCDTAFWKPSEIAIRSLIFPSWGDFLMKHYTLAFVELFGTAIAWLVAFFMLASAGVFGGPAIDIGGVIAAIVVLGFVHVPDAWLTYYIANKGLHPKDIPSASESAIRLEASLKN